MSETPVDGTPVDPVAFWHVGPLPAAPPADGAGADVAAPARLGRPEVTVDGRNLADVLAPAYRALLGD